MNELSIRRTAAALRAEAGPKATVTVSLECDPESSLHEEWAVLVYPAGWREGNPLIGLGPDIETAFNTARKALDDHQRLHPLEEAA